MAQVRTRTEIKSALDAVAERASELTELLSLARSLRNNGSPRRAEALEQEAVEFRNYTVSLIRNWTQLGMLPLGIPRQHEVLFGLKHAPA